MMFLAIVPTTRAAESERLAMVSVGAGLGWPRHSRDSGYTCREGNVIT